MSEVTKVLLTFREYEILPLIYTGLSRKEIAEKLKTNLRTIDSRISNIFKLCQVKNKNQLVYKLANNLLEFEVVVNRSSRKIKNLGE
jgi:DNA-binding NarL/FixJ family response regulator